MRNQKGRADIDRENFIPLLGCDRFDICGFKNASIVDEQIDLLEMFQHAFDRIFGAFRPAKIAFESKSFNTCSF